MRLKRRESKEAQDAKCLKVTLSACGRGQGGSEEDEAARLPQSTTRRMRQNSPKEPEGHKARETLWPVPKGQDCANE